MKSFLDNGGNLYIESVDLGKDLNGSGFFEYLGITYLNDGGDDEVANLYGGPECITSGLEANYNGGSDPHYSVDRLSSLSAQLLFSCENDYGRMFLYDHGNYKVAASSVMMGAIANGTGLNTKPYIVGEIVNYFLGYNPYTSVNDQTAGTSDVYVSPNPFTTSAEIHFSVQKAEHVQVEVYDMNGRLVKQLTNRKMAPGNYTVIWDAVSQNGAPAEKGIYFGKINIGNTQWTKKMILLKP